METMSIKPVKITQPFAKNIFEKEHYTRHAILAGIDEAGRGPLAGPVVAAAVCLPFHFDENLLQDSKQLSPKQLHHAYQWIIANCQYGIGVVSPRIIDKKNIYRATQSAMQRALHQLQAQLRLPIQTIIVDAMPITYAQAVSYHFCKGETWSSSIAAASIIAKVHRDKVMGHASTIFPAYFLAKHKGYCTKLHQETLRTQQSSMYHRQSFLSFLKKPSTGQASIFS